jgi:hypothetical protein
MYQQKFLLIFLYCILNNFLYFLREVINLIVESNKQLLFLKLF